MRSLTVKKIVMNKHFYPACLMLFLAVNSVASEKIRLTTGEWLPYLSQELKHNGVGAHIVTEAFLIEGIEVELHFFPWARAYKLAKEGKWDGSLIWSFSPDRAVDFNYSAPIFKDTMVFFHLRKKDFNWNTIEDLNGIRIGATSSYNYGTDFKNSEAAGNIDVQWVPSDKMNLHKLIAGRIDIFPWELSSGYIFLNKHFKSAQAQLVTHHPKPLKEDTYHLLIPKKSENSHDLLKHFNNGLERLRKSGKIKQYFSDSQKGLYKK